jgi:hypothetical protein
MSEHKEPVLPEASFGVASWLLLRAILASTPDLKSQELLDRVLLSLERLQASEPDQDGDVAALFAGARRLVDNAIRQIQIDSPGHR